MNEQAALLLTDIVDSVATAQHLGDEAAALLWAAHDRLARDLLHQWRGQEIDKSDGFLILFGEARDALGYVLGYHQALAALPMPLRARAGLHVGAVNMRQTPAIDVARGAKPIEVDGVSKPIAARVMSAALGGQTLLTAAAVAALGDVPQRLVSHGFWRVKGIPEPLELFEVGEAGAPFAPPPDSAKVYRVVAMAGRDGAGDGLWLPVREVPHTLPAERDAFVGRRATLVSLAGRYNAGARLVSLLGIGGGGKTRVAVRYGWIRLGDYPGGVWFCELAPARSIEGLVSAVAQGLQLPLGKDDPVEQIGHAIAGRGACLVILDNFEHLARHAEGTLGHWLERAPDARFLVTTREVLGIAGEEAVTLAPLPPDDAQALFMRRAAATKRDFNPGPDDRAAIPKLVKLLDGLPLAIELAAARARMLSPLAMLARMSERFKLLSSGGHRLDRQATLRAAFDWSWELLPPTDKAALAQLSVFEGGFTLEAAEAVLELGDGGEAPWTVDVVQSLVDKSFVRTLDDDRFDLLGSVQDYAAEHLRSEGRYAGSGPPALRAAQARHGLWFAELGPTRAVLHACADLDNLVAACRRAVHGGSAPVAAGALEGAWAALALQGPFKAGVDLAAAVCAMPTLSAAAAVRAHTALAAALVASGQRAAAQAHYETAVSQAQQDGDPQRETVALVGLGMLQARAGHVDAAAVTHRRALELAGALDDGPLQCAALNGLGTAEFEQGRMEQAEPHYAAALQIAQRCGDRRWQAMLLGNLGNLHANLGHMGQARSHSLQALAIARELGDRQREGNTLGNLGMLHYVLGHLDEAAEASEAALVIARELGHVRLECIVLCNLGIVHHATGRLDEARVRFEASLAAARTIGDRHTESQVLGYLGLVHAHQGAFAVARDCHDEAQHIMVEISNPLSMGLLQCQRAECEWLAGHRHEAFAARERALLLAEQTGAGPESELGLALAKVGTLFSAPMQ